MTFTNSCLLFFLCFIMPLVFCDVGMHSGPSASIHFSHANRSRVITESVKEEHAVSLAGSSASIQILHSSHANRNRFITESVKAEHAVSTSRKFLFHGSCTNRDISISQSRDSTSGIPQYIVQIVNTCVSGCAPHDIHLHCGWFASARIINPRLFKRLSYDDCLVNGGNHLASTQIIRFTYSNSFMYPLTFKSAKFC